MLSASFLDKNQSGVVELGKDVIKWLLEQLGLYQRGQFWGWMRTRSEYQTIMRNAGLTHVTDGFIETLHQQIYWIKGNGVSRT